MQRIHQNQVLRVEGSFASLFVSLFVQFTLSLTVKEVNLLKNKHAQ